MDSEYKRLLSFQSAANFTGSPAELAENGLYYASFEIRCAFCNFTFSLLNDDDDVTKFFERPAREHIKQCPRCPHMRKDPSHYYKNKPLYEFTFHKLVDHDYRIEVVRLRSFYWMCNSSSRDRERLSKNGLYYNSRVKAICCAFCPFRITTDLAASLVIERHVCSKDQSKIVVENVPLEKTDFLCFPKHPEMESFAKRYATFCSKLAPQHIEWPHEKSIPRRDLATCGFFFRNVFDLVTCFWCNLTLGQWDPRHDVPRFEHFDKNPYCRVALSMVDSKEIIERIKEDPKEEEISIKCVICYDKFRNILFFKCKHFVCCEKCSLKIYTCPVCRQNIEDKMEIYL